MKTNEINLVKIIRAVGKKLLSVAVKTTTDQNLLPSLDNYYTKKYNNCDNFKWHKAHPLSGAKFSRRGLSPTATPNAIISEQYKNNQRFFNIRQLSIIIFIISFLRLKFAVGVRPYGRPQTQLYNAFNPGSITIALKQFILIFLLVFGLINFSFADTQPQTNQPISTTPESITQEMAKIFANPNDAIITNGACEFKCRNVNPGYVTQINGFDFAGGVTYCEIFKENDLEKPLKYNANQINYSCINEWQKEIPLKPQYAIINKTTNIKSKISQKPSDTDITLSRFLAGIVTLDPKIINRDATNISGQIVLANGITTRSGGVSGLYDYFEKNPNDSLFEKTLEWFGEKVLENNGIDKPLRTLQGERTSTAEGFNKANLAYFSNLFQNMNEIYQHLQWLLFVIVGGFFLTSIGVTKFQNYLENNGADSGSNQKYLHKFLIPLIAVGFFFMPIPEGNSMKDQATMIQNIIRYFTAKATDIADIASAKGGATYMNKIYASVGGVSADAEIMYHSNLAQNNFIKKQASEVYQEKCSTRFSAFSDMGVPFAQMSEQELKEYLEANKIDINQISGTSNDIKFETCIVLEQMIWNSNSEIKKAQNNLDGIKRYYTNDKLQENLQNIDKYLANRENELGWINSTLLAPSALMVEIQDMISDNIIQQDSVETNTQKNQNAIIENQRRGTVAKGETNKKLSDSAKGYIMGKSAWFIIPGTYQIYQIIKENASTLFTALGAFFGSVAPGGGTILGGAIGWIVGNIASSLGAFIFAPVIMEFVLEKVPTLVIAVAGMISLVSYLVSLCKYFYLSPFVVAFALTTKRLDKITNFLVSGIAIFFKPILIVLFIFLALFLNTLLKEILIFMSIEQFGVLKVSSQDFFASFSIEAIKSILKIFGILASIYISFRLIIGGPDWAMKLIGIDGSHDDMISQSMSQKLESKSFMA